MKDIELYIQHLLKGVWLLAGSLITGFTSFIYQNLKRNSLSEKGKKCSCCLVFVGIKNKVSSS